MTCRFIRKLVVSAGRRARPSLRPGLTRGSRAAASGEVRRNDGSPAGMKACVEAIMAATSPVRSMWGRAARLAAKKQSDFGTRQICAGSPSAPAAPRGAFNTAHALAHAPGPKSPFLVPWHGVGAHGSLA